MDSIFISPVEVLARHFNGKQKAAIAIGCSPSAISHWINRHGGYIPDTRIIRHIASVVPEIPLEHLIHGVRCP